MPTRRFQPPTPRAPVAQSFDEVARVVDALAPLERFALRTERRINATAGSVLRLAPRATGQEVVIPEADGSNFNQTITLFVQSALGSLRVRAAVGTINGASAFTLAAGLTTVLVLRSNGETGWVMGFDADTTYSPGDGIDIVGTTISVDASDLVGTGIVDDGANNFAVDQAFAPTWTGTHTFNAAVKLANDETVATVGTITDHALLAATNRLRMGGGAGDRLLVSMDPGASPDGRIVIIQNIDGTAADDLEVQHDDGVTGTATMRFLCADQRNARIGSRGMGIAAYDSTSARWYLTVVSAEATRLLSIHGATAADAAYSVTPPTGATWFKAFAKAGGSGGGGADAETALEVCAGGGGGEGCEAELWIPVSTGAITGAIGGGGTAGADTGGNGGAGGGTTIIYNGSTYTLNQGGIGIGTATGIVGAGGSATLGGSGGGGALTAGADISIFSQFITGEDGSPSTMIGAAAVTAEAAIGGNGAGRGGGRGGLQVAAAGASAGSNATGQGCGGGGGARIVSASAVVAGAAGGTGSPGYVRFEFYSGPVPTFTAVV
jgi:hypothetical protein